MGHTSNIDDKPVSETPETTNTEPESNSGDVMASPLFVGEHTEFSKIDLGYTGLDIQRDGFGSISFGKEIGTIHTGKDVTMSVLSVRAGIDGEIFMRAQTLGDDLERTTHLTDFGLLNQDIGDLTGSSSFYDNPLDAHHDNQHFIGIRTLKEFDGIENGTLTLTGSAGAGLDGNPLISAGILRNYDGEKWDISYGTQASLTGEGARFDAAINVQRDWKTKSFVGDFNAAAQLTIGTDPTATVAADVTARLTDEAVSRMGGTFFGKEAGKLSTEFGGSAQYTGKDIVTEVHLGIYRDVDIDLAGTEINVGKFGVEIEKELTGEQETNVNLGMKFNF